MRNDLTLEETLSFLEYHPQATVMDIMAEYDLSEAEALEVLTVVKRFLQRPPEEQRAVLRFLEWTRMGRDAY